MGDLGSWSDNHLEPVEDPILGYDWKGNELYGYEYGYDTEVGFVPEEDVTEYVENTYGLIMFNDTVGGF